MNVRRIVPIAAVGVLAAGAFLPASAAPKPKPFAGTYKVTLAPDPSPNVFTLADMNNCQNLNPASVDEHPLTVPRAGKLDVVLDSPDPTGAGVTDWDLYVVDKAGDTIGESHGATSHEETTVKLKAKETVTIIVCNLAGSEEGTVTYSLR